MRRVSARWIIAAIGLTIVVWLTGLAGLLAIANRVHDDIPEALAVKLPLLQLQPELIFAGDSRMAFQVDPVLSAQLVGKPPGFAVNIAYLAGDPLSFVAAARRYVGRFKNAHVVVSVTTLISNDGVPGASVFPQDVVARMNVAQQITTFLPMRVGTLIRYIHEAFNSRLAADRNISEIGPHPAEYGLERLPAQPGYRWPPDISSHQHFKNWNIAGLKARNEIGALCGLAGVSKKLTVVLGPWAPRYNRDNEPSWKAKDEENTALLAKSAETCGFELVKIPSVPGLTQEHFADEQHINESGIPIYTSYLMTQLKN
ncbi:MAG: hypothetical protein JWQ24_5485 [Tardiphaga sp.]|nr:hypothetical protein [Tardiphaga sp.]